MLFGDEESIELLYNIVLGYDKFGKEVEDIFYYIVRILINEILLIIWFIKNVCLKLYNLVYIVINFFFKLYDLDDFLFKKLFFFLKLMIIIGDEIFFIFEK